MKTTYKTKNTCADEITVDIENGIVQEVSFRNGCAGNHSGISALVKGMTAKEAMEKLSGIKCGARGTSCPDQLAKAISINLGLI